MRRKFIVTHHIRDGDRAKNLVQQHWNGRASMFDSESQHGIHSEEQHDRWLTVLRKWAGADPCQVFDVGCGTGVVSLLLAELGHDVVGVDFAPAMLERARTKAQRVGHSIGFHRGDAETLAVPDDAVELVTARHLIWTLPNPHDALREWKRVVEPDGQILLIEGYWDHSEPWDEYEEVHDDLPMYDGRPPAELAEVLRQRGVTDVTYESLADATLWGREPRHDYYLMTGTVPRDGPQ